MASTLTPTTFKIKIIEEQIVGNNIVKSEINHSIPNVTNIDRRIVTCPQTTSIDLFNLNGPNPGAGTFPSSSFSYARITNLDNEYNVAIIISGSQGNFTQQLSPTNTWFLSSPHVTSSDFNGGFEDQIESIQIYAISGSVDIEYTLINI
jgi:hypothetical protein